MGGLAILFFVGFYVLVSLFVLVVTPGWWRLGVLAAIALIPTADALWGRYVTLPNVCEQAGLKVYRTGDRAGGIMEVGGPPTGYFIEKHGFPFEEGREASGVWYRFTRDGRDIVKEAGVQPTVKYTFAMVTVGEPNFRGSAFEIRDRVSGELFGRLASYGYGGGWAERFISSFTDSGSQAIWRTGCDIGEFSRDRVISAVFEPGDKR